MLFWYFCGVFSEDPGRDSAFTYLRSTRQGALQYEGRCVYAAPGRTFRRLCRRNSAGRPPRRRALRARSAPPALASHLSAKAAAFASHPLLPFHICST